MVTARRGRLEALLEPLHGEIQGLQAAIDEGVGQVIIETDATAVLQAVYSDAYDLSAMATLVAELRNLLYLNFVSWRVQQRPRSCNRVALAHELAALGSLCYLDAEPILVSIPSCIQSVIAEDSASFE